MTACNLAGIDHAPVSQQKELVEERDDIRAWLVNRKDDGSVVVTREGHEGVDDIECVVCVQA